MSQPPPPPASPPPASPPPASPPPASPPEGRQRRSGRRTTIGDPGAQRTRAWSGMLVVIGGDAAIVIGAVFSILIAGVGSDGTVAILTSAFTAIGSMTSAYF